MSPDPSFYYKHAGFSYDPKTQTADEGRAECAFELARAALISSQRGWVVTWEPEPDPNSCAFDDDDDNTTEYFGCILRDSKSHVLASLWCIGDPEANYCQVVQAELALEALDDEYKCHVEAATALGLEAPDRDSYLNGLIWTGPRSADPDQSPDKAHD